MNVSFLCVSAYGRQNGSSKRVEFLSGADILFENGSFRLSRIHKKDEFFNSSFMHNLKRITYPFHPEKVLF